MRPLLVIPHAARWAWLLAALPLAACWIAYAPGLTSSFLFDDAANLPVLGDFGRIDHVNVLLRYLTAGHADPTGRPVALLSFLMDARNWPSDPYPFKRTNLLLHLINGALLFVFLRRYGSEQALGMRVVRFASFFAAAAWLLHPLFVSTVLYIVQREAMLPATFVLLGLHSWLWARRRFFAGRRAGPILVIGVLGCTALAFLSKANGLVLPLLVLVVEATLPKSAKDEASRATYRRWLYATTWPIAGAILLGVSAIALKSIGHGTVHGRSFSILQRLITEPAILLDYLKLLWLVDPHYGSLFHDQYTPATGLLTPWTTLPSIALCVGLCVGAWICRRRHPAIAVAILFFFAGHVIESTSLALELYFEHRNYLPAMLLFWPLGVALASPRERSFPTAVAVLILVGLAFLTYTTASIWGRPLDQARVWASEAPQSARAQAYAAQTEAEFGHIDQALRLLEQARLRFPDELQIALPIINLRCSLHVVREEDWAGAERAFRDIRREPGRLLIQWMSRALEDAAQHTCPGLDRARIAALLDAAEANPRISSVAGRMQDIAHLRALLALQADDARGALAWFNAALKLDPKPAVALEQAAVLGSSGYPREGLDHLDYFKTLEVAPVQPTQGMPWLHEWVLERQDYWSREIERMRGVLAHDKRSGNS